MADTASAIAPSTKPPTAAECRRLAMACLEAVEELASFGVRRIRQQLPRGAARHDRARLGVEQDAVVAERENARQLVRDHHDGHPQALAQVCNQLVEPARRDWIQSCRWL